MSNSSFPTIDTTEIDWFPTDNSHMLLTLSSTTSISMSSLSHEQMGDLEKSITYSGEELKSPSIELQDIDWWKSTKFANLVEKNEKGEIVLNFGKTGETDFDKALYAMSMATQAFALSEEKRKIEEVLTQQSKDRELVSQNIKISQLRKKKKNLERREEMFKQATRKRKGKLLTLDEILKKPEEKRSLFEKQLVVQHQDVIANEGKNGANYIAKHQLVMNFGRGK